MYDVLVHNKKKGALGYKAKFTFKWIPALHFRTPAGETAEDRARNSGAFKHMGPEALSLVTLLLTASFAVGGVWHATKMPDKLGLMKWLK